MQIIARGTPQVPLVLQRLSINIINIQYKGLLCKQSEQSSNSHNPSQPSNSETKLIFLYSLENTRPHRQLRLNPQRLPIVPSSTEILEPSLDDTHSLA